MQHITSTAVTPIISALFDLSRPTMLRACNVLEGITSGQIIVDDLAQPTWAAVRQATYGTLYPGGQIDATILAALVDHVRQIGEVGIGCWPDDQLNDMLPPDPQYDGRTLVFPSRSATVALEPFIDTLPSGYMLAPRNAQWLPQSFDYADNLATFGSAAQILQHTFGVVILSGGQVICEAATGAATHDQIEVGVTTDPAHRQRGLATVACAMLIAECEAQGLATWWDCAAQNVASIKLARRLGYCNERQYRYCWWPKH